MKTRWVASSLLLTAIGLALAPHPAAATPPDSVAKCIQVVPEARYRGYGYNHIVHVANVCQSNAECDVSTDVNPQAQHISLAGGATTEVNTFLGSPARVFTPKVDCKLSAR
jgi:hypothetical protein